jgi:ABC-2 type transport system permease protein
MCRQQLHAALVIAKKDVRIYYFKAPVMTFGLIFPLFFFLAFAVGRPVAPGALVPGMLVMALFFSASAVGPLITPWERQARTYERLVTSPASLESILLGDIIAASGFGAVVCVVPLLVGLATTPARVREPVQLTLGILLGSVAFAALGVLLAARATDAPSEVMMLSNLVRLPLIFVSGVFVPLTAMPPWGRSIACLSPLSYSMDLLRGAFGQPRFFPAWISLMALAVSIAGFFALARTLHGRLRSGVP